MSIELSRAAHYTGSGLETPVEVWQGRLDDFTEVYFTRPYDDKIFGDVPTEAMVVATYDEGIVRQYHYEFMDVDGEMSWEIRAMLANAAIYHASREGGIILSEDADAVESMEETSTVLRGAGIYRTRYLPQPKRVELEE